MMMMVQLLLLIFIVGISSFLSLIKIPVKTCKFSVLNFPLSRMNKETSATDQLLIQVQPATDEIEPPVVSDEVEGYLSPDFSSIGDGKQIRVLLYIGLALIPCLALIPFFLSREFVPPIDTDYTVNVIKNSN